MNKFANADNLKVKDQILYRLKTKGAQTATELAKQLQVSPMAIRQHLQTLGSEQLVVYEEERQPVGRPVKLWQLTDTGNKLFPDKHAELVVKLIEGVKTVHGDRGMEALLAERTRSQIDAYSAQLENAQTWREKVAILAKLRSQEGYMAEVIEQSPNDLLLVENHCSIRAAAQNCSRFCGSEWEVFRTLLEPEVTVERVEHILNGDRRCAYLISRHQ